MDDRLKAEAESLDSVIATGPRLVVLGSTSFRGEDGRKLCQSLAAGLAKVAPLIVLTGGMDGVGRVFERSFAKARQTASLPENLYHLLPRGFGPCDTGVTLVTGIDLRERREVLGRLSDVCLVIEGGPGTEHEVAVATSRRIPLVPLGRSSGHAGELHARLLCPLWAPASDWALLGDRSASHGTVVSAVRRLVQAALARGAEPMHPLEPAAARVLIDQSIPPAL
jgi:hypothetical protein